MQWLIDIATEAMENWIYKNGIYRTGEPTHFGRFLIGAFTLDGARHTLDLSAKLPDNARAVNLAVLAVNPNVNQYLRFMHPDAASETGRCVLRTQIANQEFRGMAAVGVSSDKKIDYMFEGALWTSITVRIRGYWL